MIKAQFRAAAKAIIQTLAPSPAQRRKRRDETGKAFQRSRVLTKRNRRSLLHFLFDGAYDPAEERAEHHRRLFAQQNEWADEADHADNFAYDTGTLTSRGDSHYGSLSGFDPEP